jgi:hypothetical protein
VPRFAYFPMLNLKAHVLLEQGDNAHKALTVFTDIFTEMFKTYGISDIDTVRAICDKLLIALRDTGAPKNVSISSFKTVLSHFFSQLDIYLSQLDVPEVVQTRHLRDQFSSFFP